MGNKVAGTLINVAAHPHEGAETYEKLFNEAFKINKAVRVHGDRYAWMSHLWQGRDGGRRYMTGDIATFTKIDTDGNWIDMETRSSADAARIDIIKQVTAGVQPNYHEFRFYIDLESHLVAVETDDGSKTFSPRMAEKFFRYLFSFSDVVDVFGEVEVHFVPDKDSLNRIINSKFLRRIDIYVTRPNADSVADVERNLLEAMKKMGAKSSSVSYAAARGETLELDEDVKNLARVARKNGHVEGNVGGGEYSTKEHPVEKYKEYDPDVQDSAAAFDDLARDLINSERV